MFLFLPKKRSQEEWCVNHKTLQVSIGLLWLVSQQQFTQPKSRLAHSGRFASFAHTRRERDEGIVRAPECAPTSSLLPHFHTLKRNYE